ncbi:tetratricopeptide repeat protein [Flavobacterium pectinovorum]|uniref:MoxR-vWA-beta-propeller ternary system domain-containing protein n=1 Tax=Flavobacterium pectinovorum TaxID=29533 RepID=A0A502E8X9_9FLAO|nr:tetratricopeptide repeat protein [Flavobacterium pectinovorum]TPG32920.1 hypothetical protein EAH81_24825 [Flavobacterium pectinovorum]
MELKLKINSKNTFPKGGIFIKSASPKMWLEQIQFIGLSLNSVKVFAVPDVTANELYGCLVVLNQNKIKAGDIGKNNCYQLVENKLFIPENTTIVPQLAKEEWCNLFSDNYHFLHPEIGLVELKDAVEWENLIEVPALKERIVIEPSKTVSIPNFISSLRIEVDREKILEAIENPTSDQEIPEELPFDLQKLVNGNQQEMDKFMELMDKNPDLALQLAIPLDTMGTSRGGHFGQFSFDTSGLSGFNGFNGASGGIVDNGNGFKDINVGRYNVDAGREPIVLSDGVHPFFKVFRFGCAILFIILMRSYDPDYSHFEFSSLFKGFSGFLILALIVWFFYSLFSGRSSTNTVENIPRNTSGNTPMTSGKTAYSGGSALIDSERFSTLQNRYEKLAEEFIAKKDYQKAARIYLKLLKNYPKAADVLEKGELYTEAAAIYLKYCSNKQKAAECYEKGRAYNEAIELYQELDNDEKVGDLYLILKNRKEANKHFRKVIENYKEHFQYVKASLVYKDKIEDITEAQELLIVGWRTNKDAGRCLNNYFANIKSAEDLSLAIPNIYKSEVTSDNAITFLNLLKHEFSRFEAVEEVTKNIAYEIVAERIDERPDVASELLSFNPNNKAILKDVMKYKWKRKKA